MKNKNGWPPNNFLVTKLQNFELGYIGRIFELLFLFTFIIDSLIAVNQQRRLYRWSID